MVSERLVSTQSLHCVAFAKTQKQIRNAGLISIIYQQTGDILSLSSKGTAAAKYHTVTY